MSTRFQIAALVFMMTNAVAFGIGIVPILMIPAFANHAFEAIPAVVLASFVISALLSWFIAPRLRASTGGPSPKRLFRVLDRVLVSAARQMSFLESEVCDLMQSVSHAYSSPARCRAVCRSVRRP